MQKYTLLSRPYKLKSHGAFRGPVRQTRPSISIRMTAIFYGETKERHSLRAASRFSLNVLRFESDLCELIRLLMRHGFRQSSLDCIRAYLIKLIILDDELTRKCFTRWLLLDSNSKNCVLSLGSRHSVELGTAAFKETKFSDLKIR